MTKKNGMKNNFKQKGFTLLEILIASGIFAAMMVMVTATIAQSSTYQTKLKAMRETSEETRRLADMITRDIRSASQSTTYTIVSVPFTFKNGLAFLKWDIDGAWHSRYNAVPSASASDANVLIIATKDSFIVYGSGKNSSGQDVICYGKISSSNLPSYGGGKDAFISDVGSCYGTYGASNHPEFVIAGGADRNVTINFGGFLPDDASIANPQQPYVKFKITAATPDQSDKNSSYTTEIDSTVAGRSYNQ